MGKRNARETPAINASSMADIAFLLLIFFLVTTTMDIDKGIIVTLPPYVPDQEQLDVKINQRNVLEILVNSKDQLLVEGELTDIAELKEICEKHVDNHGNDPDFSISPDDAVVSLQNDKGTSYNRYIEVYNEIRAGYNTLRDKKCRTDYGIAYELADTAQQRTIRRYYPLRLSEADPTDFSNKDGGS